MIIERRRYSVERGRMDEMHDRMSDLLLPLFRLHNIPSPIAIWEDRDGTSILTWLIEWPSWDDRQARWAAFYPHFYTARAKQDIREFVTRTDLTLINPWSEHPITFPGTAKACETGWHPEPMIGKGAAFRTAMTGDDIRLFRDAGVSSISVSDLIFGPLPKAMVILSWPDEETRAGGIAQLASAKVPNPLADSLGLPNNILDHGLWEQLDRAPYLNSWRLRQS